MMMDMDGTSPCLSKTWWDCVKEGMNPKCAHSRNIYYYFQYLSYQHLLPEITQGLARSLEGLQKNNL